MPAYMAQLTISDSEANLLPGEVFSVIAERVSLRLWSDFANGVISSQPRGWTWDAEQGQWILGGPGTPMPLVMNRLSPTWMSWRGVWNLPGILDGELLIAQFVHPRNGMLGPGDPMIVLSRSASTVMLQLT